MRIKRSGLTRGPQSKPRKGVKQRKRCGLIINSWNRKGVCSPCWPAWCEERERKNWSPMRKMTMAELDTKLRNFKR